MEMATIKHTNYSLRRYGLNVSDLLAPHTSGPRDVPRCGALSLLQKILVLFFVFLVNDSEYSKSTGAKPILSPGCIYLVSPGALRAPTPPRPPFFGEGKYQKKH
jgi:hypothetical protein